MDGSVYLFAGLFPGCDGVTSNLCAIKSGAPDTNANDIPDSCENTCRADFNGDGSIDPDDLGDYINCYFAPVCEQGDFNGDGSQDPDDLGDFINIYFAGCQ